MSDPAVAVRAFSGFKYDFSCFEAAFPFGLQNLKKKRTALDFNSLIGYITQVLAQGMDQTAGKQCDKHGQAQSSSNRDRSGQPAGQFRVCALSCLEGKPFRDPEYDGVA